MKSTAHLLQRKTTTLVKPALKLMLVDDKELAHFIMRKFISMQLPSTTEVITYTRPEVALADITRQQPDLIFLDLCLPMVDQGFEFLDHMRRKQLDNKVVILTAAIDNATRRRCFLHTNVVEFITKPISPVELFRVIRQHA